MNGALQNENGPAATAIAPDRGSIKNLEDIDMNSRSNITTKRPDAMLNAFRDLESPIAELLSMSDIAAFFVEEINFTQHIGEYGQVCVSVPKSLAERVVFTVYRAHELAIALGKHFHATLEGQRGAVE